ncbi:hypothetical protein [Pseudomonas sp. 1176_21]|uniref:hypothetical protein n=1 Tax=Pseudomonas sp. 1176_21 TaxID=2604453 RepID=UPI0040649AB0
MSTQSLANLELMFAFEKWAKPRGYDLATHPNGGSFINLETRNAWLGFEGAHGPAGCRPIGQQLYAQLKKTSEYAHQTGEVFSVRVAKAPFDDYVIHGGPGGLYRQRDVDLFVIEDGKQYCLS